MIPSCSASIPNTPKLCVNCKYFTKNFFNKNEYGKCFLFPKEIDNDNYFVTGKLESKLDYYYCSTARTNKNMCDKEGKYYEEY